MRWIGLLIGLGVAASAVTSGCDVFDADLLPAGDGSPEDEPDSGEEPFDDGCTDGSLRPPPRPTDPDDGTSLEHDLVFALKDVVLSDRTAGLNIDELCTGPDGPWSCLPPRDLERYEAGHDVSPPLDGPMGLDNEFSGQVYDLVNETSEEDLELTAQVPMVGGRDNVVVILRDYNGQANDSRVTVILTQTVFSVVSETDPREDVCVDDSDGVGQPYNFHPEGGCDLDSPIPGPEVGLEFDDDGNPTEIVSIDEAWDTGDLWFWGRDDTFANGDINQPTVVIDTAYVTDWTLVARLPDNQLFHLGTVQAWLHGTYAVAKLKPDLSGSEPLDVLVAGRWGVSGLLRTAESVGICRGDPLYAIARSELERNADVRTRAEDEGEDVPCNAVSFGIRFTAHRGNFGGLAPGAAVPAPCDEPDEDPDAGVGDSDAGVGDSDAGGG
jgi:hypothetical protein